MYSTVLKKKWNCNYVFSKKPSLVLVSNLIIIYIVFSFISSFYLIECDGNLVLALLCVYYFIYSQCYMFQRYCFLLFSVSNCDCIIMWVRIKSHKINRLSLGAMSKCRYLIKNLIPLVLFLTPPPPPLKTKLTKSFVTSLSIHNQDKQQSKLNYVDCGEEYLEDLTKVKKVTKYEYGLCRGWSW